MASHAYATVHKRSAVDSIWVGVLSVTDGHTGSASLKKKVRSYPTEHAGGKSGCDQELKDAR